MWEKTSKPVEKSDRLLKKIPTREWFTFTTTYFLPKDFTFGLRTVTSDRRDSLIQTTHVPMLIYELPSLQSQVPSPCDSEKFWSPHDQMLYHRTILEPHTAYPIPAGTHYIVLTVQKPPLVWTLSTIPSAPAPSEGIPRGRFPENEKFNQTPYKLPPPTPIHVPAEKRPLEEKALHRKRVHVLEPVPIPDVPPVHIPQTPVQIQIPRATCADSDVLEPVQIPQPPVQNPETPVQISDVLEPVQMSQNHLCRFSHPRTTCADSDVLEPVQIPDVLEPVQIPVIQTCRFSRTYADSSVTRPTATYADSPRTYEHSTCICADSRGSRTCADSNSVSHVPQPPMQVLHVSESVQIPVVPQPPVQIPNEPVRIPSVQIPVVPQSPVQSLPEPMQLLPELDMLDPLSRQMHSTAHVVCIWTPRTPAASHGTLYF
ncbi:uncharacterized protein TNCV_2258761 [Trichonephila clavipes]|nr:uncharacterized protein TNCV_2258761 [Trichonephila clavipes]